MEGVQLLVSTVDAAVAGKIAQHDFCTCDYSNEDCPKAHDGVRCDGTSIGFQFNATVDARIRKAGELLHEHGGFRAMQEAFYMVVNHHLIPGLYSAIEILWDGIGNWVA